MRIISLMKSIFNDIIEFLLTLAIVIFILIKRVVIISALPLLVFMITKNINIYFIVLLLEFVALCVVEGFKYLKRKWGEVNDR